MQTVPGFDLFEPTDVLVLGVGNILWADEGFGVRAVEAFNARYKLPERTKVADGGTLGMYLLELIGATKDLLLLTAQICRKTRHSQAFDGRRGEVLVGHENLPAPDRHE